MKGGLAILVTFLICLMILTLYIFLGKKQITTKLMSLNQEIESLEKEIDEIRYKETEIGRLTKQLPVWLKQTSMFRKSIPESVDDHIFFASLASELENYPDIRLLSVESVHGGSWLGEVKEDEATELRSLGIDPQVAAGIRVLYYSINLNGEFDDILNVFENLKKSQRLYTIDLIAGPAASGSGTISVNSDKQSTPLQFTGRLYFSLPDPALNADSVEEMFFDALTKHIHRKLVESGGDVVDVAPAAEDEASEDAESAGDPAVEPGESTDSDELVEESDPDSIAADTPDWQAVTGQSATGKHETGVLHDG